MAYQWIDLPSWGAPPRGVLEVMDRHDLPFSIERVFWISEAGKEAVRGEHGHLYGHEILIPLKGALDLELWSKDHGCAKVHLNSSRRALWLKPGAFIEMRNFDPCTLLLVLCSHPFKDDPVSYTKEDFMPENKKNGLG
jgi:hypothetical protein